MEASDAVRIEWQRRIATEYAVCAFAQEFARRLTMFGSPPELIERALVMALDELEHARGAVVVAAAARAKGAVIFDPEEFAVESALDPAVNIAVATVSSLCLGETLALRMVHELRENARVVEAQQALDRVIADEPRHAALGWETLDWLLGLPQGDVVGEVVERELPRWIATLRGSFAGPEPEPHLTDLTEDDLAWGLAPVDDYRVWFEETVERDWKPRLARRGFAIA